MCDSLLVATERLNYKPNTKMTTITAQDIADQLNASGYDYFGDKARAFGNRIQFGKGFVRWENGKLTNNKEGKARALTIGWPAVEACEKAVAEIEAQREAESAAKAAVPQNPIKVAKAVAASEIGNCPRSVDAMLSYVPRSVIAKLNSSELAELMDAMWRACQDAKAIAQKESGSLA